jgi:hypothetical protein
MTSLPAPTQERAALPAPCIFQPSTVSDGRCGSTPDVSDVRQDWLEQQWLRDLDTLDRIEQQNECFFEAMGSLRASRMEGRVA